VYSVTLRNDGRLSELSRKNSLHSRRQGKSVRLTADDAGAAAAFARRAVRDAGMALKVRRELVEVKSEDTIRTASSDTKVRKGYIGLQMCLLIFKKSVSVGQFKENIVLWCGIRRLREGSW